MTTAEIRDDVLDILSNIAPDEDLSDLKDDVSFREQLELDSMDFLDIVMELRKRYRIQIPEDDYMELASMDSTVKYLEPHDEGPAEGVTSYRGNDECRRSQSTFVIRHSSFGSPLAFFRHSSF